MVVIGREGRNGRISRIGRISPIVLIFPIYPVCSSLQNFIFFKEEFFPPSQVRTVKEKANFYKDSSHPFPLYHIARSDIWR